MNVTEKIKSLRMNKGYSQEFMASKIGVSQRAYSKIENEETKLDIDKLLKISDILEVEPSELLNGEFNQTNNFNNYKTITNAVVNNYAKAQDEFNKELIQLLKVEIENLRLMVSQKDELIKELIQKIK